MLIALCRPYRDGAGFATPATNQQIAAEVFLSIDAVKMHLRALFARFELAELPQNRKRAALAECALQFGVISQRELIERPVSGLGVAQSEGVVFAVGLAGALRG